MANLIKNYSPHIKPDVEKASATSELHTVLSERARDMLEVFLRTWRRERTENRHRTDHDRALGSVRAP
jgi:vacuolar protein sorting-associated protein 3